MLRYLEDRLREHKVCSPYADYRAHGLGRDIARNVAPAHPALARISQRDGRIEMRAGNRAESKNERYQRRARRQRIRE